MEITDYLEDLCRAANPHYLFMHEDADMINVKADALRRGDKFVYVEALRTGRYTRNRFGVKTRTYNVRLFFCQFTEFGNDMRATVLPGGRVSSDNVKNEQVLRDIETEIVAPFVDLLDTPEATRRLLAGVPWTNISFQYPPSRYDGNELSVMLEFVITEPIC